MVRHALWLGPRQLRPDGHVHRLRPRRYVQRPESVRLRPQARLLRRPLWQDRGQLQQRYRLRQLPKRRLHGQRVRLRSRERDRRVRKAAVRAGHQQLQSHGQLRREQHHRLPNGPGLPGRRHVLHPGQRGGVREPMRGHGYQQLRKNDRLPELFLHGERGLLPRHVLHAELAVHRPVWRRQGHRQLRRGSSVHWRLLQRPRVRRRRQVLHSHEHVR